MFLIFIENFYYSLIIFPSFKFLATGEQVSSIAFAHRIGELTAYKIIKETCIVTIKVLSPIYLKPPKEEDWKRIGFWNRWNFPNCTGTIDGKHFVIKASPNSGSLYFNHKKSFSVVLLAACHDKYKFTIVDCGAYGNAMSLSDKIATPRPRHHIVQERTPIHSRFRFTGLNCIKHHFSA